MGEASIAAQIYDMRFGRMLLTPVSVAPTNHYIGLADQTAISAVLMRREQARTKQRCGEEKNQYGFVFPGIAPANQALVGLRTQIRRKPISISALS